MRRGDAGVWAITLPGNLHGVYYIYRIYFPDGRVHEVVDPYARSAGANGVRGMVVDLAKAAPEGWEQDTRPDIPAHARSVWEVHVADFSADEHSGVNRLGAANSWASPPMTRRWTVTANTQPA